MGTGRGLPRPLHPLPLCRSDTMTRTMNADLLTILELDQAALADQPLLRAEPRYRVRQIWEWVYRHACSDFAAMTNLPRDLRERLAGRLRVFAGEVVARRESSDGTTKLLLAWPDGATSECVVIPDGSRRTVCVSTQVGCPVRCAFCASGLEGMQRNLTAAEIVEQVLRARQICRPDDITNVVFMGSGEPLANFPALVAAIERLTDPQGMNFSRRRITVSTIGLPARIRQLADRVGPVNLAISVHAPNDGLRAELIPWAARIPLAEVVEAARYFFERTGREITLEYLLLAGVNDRPRHARQLARLARSLRCNVNLIRYNPVPDLPFARPTGEATWEFQRRLRALGVNAHVRRSRGLDIEAACGQLRRRTGAEPLPAAAPHAQEVRR